MGKHKFILFLQICIQKFHANYHEGIAEFGSEDIAQWMTVRTATEM